MKWISVEDELPLTTPICDGSIAQDSETVLFFSSQRGALVGFLMNTAEKEYLWLALSALDNYLVTHVTHWMPLPAPPD